MKKWTLLIVIAIGIILSACGQNEPKETSSGAAGNEGDKKTLRLVTDAAYAPFEYMDGDKVVGFDIDFIKAAAEEAGFKLKIEHVGWDPVFVEIEGKTADLSVSSITVDDDRKQTYDFSVPYFISTNKILVPEGSDIKSAADLKDKVVAVQNGTTGQAAAEQILGDKSGNLKKFESNNLAIQELISGGADAVVADNGVVEEYAKNNPNQKLVVIEDENSFEKEYYGIMFPKGSNLVTEFNKAINTMFENGKYEDIYKKWFGKEPDIEELKAQQ